jgi:hypothetical protein
MKTRIQVRGICPICTKQHAVSNNTYMVPHGYTISWGSFNGSCFGVNAPHLGDINAPAFIKTVILKLENHLANLPGLIQEAKEHLEGNTEKFSNTRKRRPMLRKIRELEHQLNHEIPHSITELKERIENWTEISTVEVDVDVEEAEQRKVREAANQIKKLEKETKQKEKDERKAAAAVKAQAKMDLLLSNQWRVIEVEGEVVAQWQERFENETLIIHRFREVLEPFLVDLCLAGKLSAEDIYYGNYKLTTRSRTGKDGKGKQLEKFDFSFNFPYIFDNPKLSHLKGK